MLFTAGAINSRDSETVNLLINDVHQYAANANITKPFPDYYNIFNGSIPHDFQAR